ncbi:MAG: efflux RND transporter periplasmic adaptor subunit [Hormoscilla sp.]
MEQLSKQKFKRGVQWLGWSGVITALAAGGILLYSLAIDRSPEPVSVPTINVKLGRIEDTINESGTVELGSQQTLKSPAEGVVEQVRVQLGGLAKSGQELVILRNPERETILTKKQLEIQQKEITLARSRQEVVEKQEKLKTAERKLQEFDSQMSAEQLEIRKQELNLANDRAKVTEKEEELAAAEGKLEELKALFERGFIAANEVRDQEEGVRRAKSALRDARLTVTTKTLETQRLQFQQQQKERELRDAIVSAKLELQKAQFQVNNNSSQLQLSQLDYQETQSKLLNSIVTATIDGKILDMQVKKGSVVQVGDELLTLGDPSQELVKLNLSILNATKVKPNQLARINVIGLDDRTFRGRVETVSPQATTGGTSSNSSGVATVSAIVLLDEPSGILIPGSQVSVEIVLQQQEDVVTLPVQAIGRLGKKSFVWVKDNQGLAEKRDVTLGLEGLSTVEVTSGLNPGEEVLLPLPDSPLSPGMPVSP